jgi:anion-transporting  ArsA/GET3 family ATPase
MSAQVAPTGHLAATLRESATMDDMAPKREPDDTPTHDGITVSRKSLTLIGAVILSLFTGGQVALDKFDEPDRAIVQRMDGLQEDVKSLQAQMLQKERETQILLRAILLYQLEADRYLRESMPNAPRSAEMDRAAQSLRDLVFQN